MSGQLLFLAPGDVNKGRVEPISWMRTCEAYAAHGLRVTLGTLDIQRPDPIRGEIWKHFGVEKSFRVVTIPTSLDHESSTAAFRRWAGAAGCLWAGRCNAQSLIRGAPVPIVHARAPVLLSPFAFTRRALPRSRRPTLVFETHALPAPRTGWIVRAADLVVVNSEKLAHDIRSVFGLDRDRVLHAPLPPFNPVQPRSKMASRRALSLEGDASIACYTGKMTHDLNEFLLRAAAKTAPHLPRFRMLLVGGNPQILAWTRQRIQELGLDEVVLTTGFVPPANVGNYQAAADVLVYHMPDTVAIFPYMTPAKGYEYQAMERPIVATNFPLFAEVFGSDGERAIRVNDRTPQGFATGIISAFTLDDGGRAMAKRAAEFVAGRTWGTRAKMILEALRV